MAQFDCDTPECVAAHEHLQEARNTILTLCEDLEALRKKKEGYLASSALFLSMATATATVAKNLIGQFPWGTIVAILLFVLAGILAAIAGVFFALALALDDDIKKLEDELAAARKDFDAAVEEVMKACPSECWGDLNQPNC
jgi:pilus assembly protein TadC